MKNLSKICKSGNLFLGLNYWSSRDAIRMWENWDSSVIEEDLKIIKEYGVTHLRIFPLWSYFQPIYALRSNDRIIEYAFADGPLPDTEAGRAGVNEEACKRFEEFCAIAEKYNLPFILLSDPERKAIEAYGVWQEKKMCGKTGMGVVRTTFIIDENGIVEKIMNKVKPDTNAQEILEAL